MELPDSWIKVVSSEILDIRDGTHDTPKYVDDEIYPLVTSKNLKNGDLDLKNVKYISKEDFLQISLRSKVDIGDILFAMIGTIGNPVLVKAEPKYAIKNIGLFKNPKKLISSELFKYYLDSFTFYSQIEEKQFLKGTTQKFIPLGHLRKIEIPLPPLPEQRAIVSKIELLFSELDNGIANLKLAQEQLKVYRQSVLKKAFEGELTKKWREKQQDLHGADELLVEISREKEEAAKATGKKLKTVKPLNETELKDLSSLPTDWRWTKIEELGEVTGGLTKNSKRNKISTKLPYLRVANVYSNELRLDDIKFIGIEEQEIPRVILKEGDLLVVEGNGSSSQIGRVAIWNGKISPCVHQNHLIKVRFQIVDIGKFILFWLISFEGRKQITRVASSTSGLYTLNISKVSSLPIPVPPLPEQQAIISEIETRLSVCDKVEQDIAENLEKAEALRQSILKKAFEGKLLNERELEEVRKADDWEPAEVLLERVRAERAESGKR